MSLDFAKLLYLVGQGNKLTKYSVFCIFPKAAPVARKARKTKPRGVLAPGQGTKGSGSQTEQDLRVMGDHPLFVGRDDQQVDAAGGGGNPRTIRGVGGFVDFEQRELDRRRAGIDGQDAARQLCGCPVAVGMGDERGDHARGGSRFCAVGAAGQHDRHARAEDDAGGQRVGQVFELLGDHVA